MTKVQEVCVSSLPAFFFAPTRILNLDLCLNSGQTFTWIRYQGHWYNTLGGNILILTTKEDAVYFFCPVEEEENIRTYLNSYFRMEYDVESLFEEWSRRDPKFAANAKEYPAIRLMDQPTFESIMTFILSQNNLVDRIMALSRSLMQNFGNHIATVDGQLKLYSFPIPDDLYTRGATEARLVELKFGYRAKYIENSVLSIVNGEFKVDILRNLSYGDALIELRKLTGVGPKVAACIALTGLGFMQAVPMDVHMLRLAKEHYYKNVTKSLFKKTDAYTELSERFVEIFGPLAGWAHLVLFAAALKQSRSLKSAKTKKS